MEEDILQVAKHAVKQPGVTGYICVDEDGLCLAAEGQASQSMSGIVHQLAELASKIEEPTRLMGSSSKSRATHKNESPVVRVDFEHYKMLIQSKESITTALISPQK